MKFTKEEISLCKQVAEKHRKSFDFGDSYINPFNNVRLHTFDKTPGHKFPLWAISDCLEFLVKKGILEFQLLFDDRCIKDKYQICIDNLKIFPAGKTPLEACLKAVLAVLEEGQ